MTVIFIPRTRRVLPLLLIPLLASCSGTGSTVPTSTVASPAVSQATVQDVCGRKVVVPSPPRRAVALEQGATEVMLSLGLADRMVGTSYLTDPVLPALASDYARVPVLAKLYPSPEAFRAAEPDFAYSMLSSAFTPEVAGTRVELESLHVPSYLTRMNCEDPKRSLPFTFESFFQEVRDIAGVFGVPARAEALIADQRKIVTASTVRADAQRAKPTVMWFYSTYNGTPVVAGPNGVPDAIGTLLGLRNVFDDLTPKWGEVSWEEIARRDPDVIVLADLTRGRPGDSATDKRRILANEAVASRLSAVGSARVVALPGSALDPSVRTAAAVGTLASALAGLGMSK